MPDVSVLIHARDAAATLPRLLRSVAWSDDVIVVAMPGGDDTEHVAERHGARVVRIPAEPWTDAIRNRHLGEARHPWTLVLDSDEWLPDDAERLVADLLQRHGATVDCFAIPRINLVEDTIMVDGDWAPDRQWRLFRTGALEYAGAHHQVPVLRDGHRSRLIVEDPDALRIHHANYATLADLVTRGARYATTDDYAARVWDPGEYARRIHGLLSWRAGAGGDGDLGRATAVVMAWNQAMEQVLHWATLAPRPPFDGALALPIPPPPAPADPPADASPPPARHPPARDAAQTLAAATLRRAWRVHAAHRRLETVPFRHSVRAPLLAPDLPRLGGDPGPIESGLARRRVVLVWRALRRSLRRRLGGGSGPYPLPPVEGVALPGAAAPRVSVVVPFRDRFEMTLQCVEEATVGAIGIDLEVILVDDGSAVDQRHVVAETPGLRYVRLEPGAGFLHAANAGAKEARGAVIVLLNNDTLPRAGWLAALLTALDEGPDVGIAGPVFLEPDGRIGEAGAGVRPDGRAVIHGHGLAERTPPFDVARDVGYVSGACLAIRRELWWDLGGFDPRYAPAYYEDTDLCLAARLRGWRIRWTPDARVIHLGGQSYGRTSARKDALLESSRHAFRAKWGRELERLASDGWHGPVLPLAPAATRGALVVVERHCVRADLDGGSVHLVQVLRELVRDRWEIAYLPLDRDLRSEAAESLRRMGIRVVADAGHAATVLGRAPTAIIVRRPDSLGSLVLELVQRWPAAALVYDTVDLHEDRLRMEAERRGDGADRVARVTAAVERAGLVAADLVVAVSEEEAAVVAERVPGATVVVAPPSFPLTADVAPRAGRAGMLLLGSYRHPPNIDAARRLATRVLPLVRAERPAAFATLAGTYPPMDLLVLRDRHGVAVPGYVADLDALHHAHVACVAPLEWGAGANGKLIAAMAAGLPVVTTTFGAIGLAARDGEHLLVADSDADLAAAYLRLEVDDDLWSRLSAGGRALVRDRYEPGVAYGALCAWLRERAPAR